MRGKRGQFFLLAAVIISAVIISLGAGINRAIVNEEPLGFYDSSEEVQREIAAFLDYAVYNDSISENDLILFLNLLAVNMEETNPNVDFAFIYTKDANNRVGVRNYGSRDIYVNDVLIEARGQTSVFVGLPDSGNYILMDDPVEDIEIILTGNDPLLVKINADDEGISFPVSGYRQVIVVAQKEERGDVYVSIG